MRRFITLLAVAIGVAHTAVADESGSVDERVEEKANETLVEEVVVVAEQDTRTFELAETVDVVPDSAALLKRVVGANVVSNGPLTGIAQYRGMSRFRINTQVNGAVISAGGPNWMDPPLSYAPAAHLESLEVFRGIASVGAGQETIGGVIKANTWRGEFADADVTTSGRVRSGSQSVNGGSLLSVAASLANERHLLSASGLTEKGDDAEFAGGEILPTEYDRDRFDVGYGFRNGGHTVRIDYGRNETGDAGTPALPMDIGYIDSDLVSLSWDYAHNGLAVRSKFHASDIEHGMTNYHLRTAPMQEAMWRRNVATGENRGFAVSATFGSWGVGVDGHEEVHNSDIDNPANPMFFVTNFNDAQRRIVGVYVERQAMLRDGWLLDMGIRFNHVSMDADPVNATPAMMGMAPAVDLRDAFNGADRSRSDENVDWVVKSSFPVSDRIAYYAGVSRKTRSPAYQERYLWLPMQATAGLADGRTYTGNLDLEPEVAHEVEFGFDWHSERLSVAPRVFYRDVADYIQGTASTNTSALMFVQMMNGMGGMSNAAPLEFSNVDATFSGLDVDWRYAIDDRWSLHGAINYVRGERDDVSDDLYRVAPLNGFVAATYARDRWSITLESFVNDGQRDVSATNSESETAGYALFHVRGHWQMTEGLKLGFGVDNLADREYVDHLAGVNRVRGNPDIRAGERLPGYGRSVFARLDFSW
jgi:iron complex outermembrane receptor protein